MHLDGIARKEDSSRPRVRILAGIAPESFDDLAEADDYGVIQFVSRTRVARQRMLIENSPRMVCPGADQRITERQ
jgi:hypothetical protein